MGNSYSGVCSIHALPAMSSRSIDIYTYISIFDFDIKVLIDFWEHDYFCGRSMNASIGLCNRDSLDTMCATFIFQTAISTFAINFKGDILDTILRCFVDIQYFNLPTLAISITAIHTKKLSSEQRCLVTTSAC